LSWRILIDIGWGFLHLGTPFYKTINHKFCYVFNKGFGNSAQIVI